MCLGAPHPLSCDPALKCCGARSIHFLWKLEISPVIREKMGSLGLRSTFISETVNGFSRQISFCAYWVSEIFGSGQMRYNWAQTYNLWNTIINIPKFYKITMHIVCSHISINLHLHNLFMYFCSALLLETYSSNASSYMELLQLCHICSIML